VRIRDGDVERMDRAEQDPLVTLQSQRRTTTSDQRKRLFDRLGAAFGDLTVCAAAMEGEPLRPASLAWLDLIEGAADRCTEILNQLEVSEPGRLCECCGSRSPANRLSR
jgi:hypothetical protein